MIQKDKVRVDIFGERFRTRASQLTPGLRVVASYINEHREVVLEQTAMEIAATLNTSDATVIRAIQALGFAGLRDLKRTLEQWLGPALSSSEKMSTTVSNLTSDVNTAIDFVLEGHLYTCNVLSEPENRHACASCSVVGAGTASRNFWHWRFGYSGGLYRTTIQPHRFACHGTKPYGYWPCRATDRASTWRCSDHDGAKICAPGRADNAS